MQFPDRGLGMGPMPDGFSAHWNNQRLAMSHQLDLPFQNAQLGRIDQVVAKIDGQRILILRLLEVVAAGKNTPVVVVRQTSCIKSSKKYLRLCGEQAFSNMCRPSKPGSSPRLRGTSFCDSGTGTGGRFIPALAGNITSGYNAFHLLTVHPRACGEHPIIP